MQNVLGVKLFKAGYFERRVCLKSTQLKQNQNKVNSARFVQNIYTWPVLFKWVGLLVLFLKAYHNKNWNSKSLQSLVTMGEDRSFGNIFWLYNFRVFKTIKFVYFRQSWGHVLELHVKAKSCLIFPASAIFQQKIWKKTWNFMVHLYQWRLTVSRLRSHNKETVLFVPLSLTSSWYSCDWPRKVHRLNKPWSHPVFLNLGSLDWESSTQTTSLLPVK